MVDEQGEANTGPAVGRAISAREDIAKVFISMSWIEQPPAVAQANLGIPAPVPA